MSEQGAPELLPCPFCGSNATASDEFNEDGYWQAFCRSCKSGTAWHPEKSRAIIAWNTRTHSDICTALVEALEGLSTRMNPKDGTHCWCTSWDWTKHRPLCIAARTAIAQAREEGVK